MPATPASRAAWVLLGEMLQERRVELDPSYLSRSEFSRRRGINYRLALDIENAARENFSRAGLALVEQAYGLARGSVQQALAGGNLEAAPGTPPTTPRVRHQLRVIGDAIAADDSDDSDDSDDDGDESESGGA